MAVTADDLDAVRALLRAYAAWLGADLPGSLEPELAALPGRYGPPLGTLLLARDDAGLPLGCVAVRALEVPGACEVKRLCVREAARGTGAGRALLEAALGFAEEAGYRRVLLDTMPGMAGALGLYRSLGFVPVAAYNDDDATPGLIYLGRGLGAG